MCMLNGQGRWQDANIAILLKEMLNVVRARHYHQTTVKDKYTLFSQGFQTMPSSPVCLVLWPPGLHLWASSHDEGHSKPRALKIPRGQDQRQADFFTLVRFSLGVMAITSQLTPPHHHFLCRAPAQCFQKCQFISLSCSKMLLGVQSTPRIHLPDV